MLVALVVVLILIVPGYFLARLLGAQKYLFPFSITLSYFIIFLSMVAVNSSVLSFGSLTFVFIGAVAFVILLSIYVRGLGIVSGLFRVNCMVSDSVSNLLMILVLVLLSLYLLTFGVYEELPSDIYQHLNYANNAVRRLERLDQGHSQSFDFIRFKGKAFYYLFIAWTAKITNLSPVEIYRPVSMVTSLMFMIGVVACADRLFKVFSFSKLGHQAAIFFTAFFVFAQMGINVFSFFRYYSFAPSMLNFVVYFAGLICLLDLFEGKGNRFRSLSILSASVLVSFVVHTQETIFILVAGLLLLFLKLGKTIFQRDVVSKRQWYLSLLVAIVLVLGVLSTYLWIRLNYDVRPFYHSKILVFSMKYLGQMYILDPSYQFLRVITVWGGLVFLLFFCFVKQISKQPFFVLAMFSPLLTLFNPAFADTFLRFGQSATLWRMSYFIPIHFVAGALVVMLYSGIRYSSKLKAGACSLALVLLFVFLLPSSFGIPINEFSRTTLAKVSEENSWHHWQDLMEYISEDERFSSSIKGRILTDPITGYMIGAITPYKSHNYKFLPARLYYNNPFAFDSYDDFPLSKYTDRILILNLRNGALSSAGEKAGHWDKNVLRLTDYYPESLLPHLQSNPDRFEQLWSNKDVFVYLIL